MDSPGLARAALRRQLAGAGLDRDGDLAQTSVLLASELFDNAVLHAGTAFGVTVHARQNEVSVAVSDHGASPLEQHLARPRPAYGRAATHGRGLMLVQTLASVWGTHHDADGTNTTWFTVRHGSPRSDTYPPQPAAAAAEEEEEEEEERHPGWSDSNRLRGLLHVSTALRDQLDTAALVAELCRRLREVLDVDGVAVEIDYGDGVGGQTLTRDGADPDASPRGDVLDLPMSLVAPLRGRLRIVTGPTRTPDPDQIETTEIGELAAHRIALAVESDWLHGAERDRHAWMTYLADTSALLGQSLDVDRTVNLIPQLVVPRLGQWCAVYLSTAGGTARGTAGLGLELAALTHTDEEQLGQLRTALDPTPAAIADVAQPPGKHAGATLITAPTDGIAVALAAAGHQVGVLVVGKPADRAHSGEDTALIGDLAARSALAIDNAQHTSAHIATSQALQQALLPRRLPTTDRAEFAARYLPASTGSDVGGDFYDVTSIGPGRWLAAIGDVCGKGARAAARAGQIRDALRVLARQARPLSEVLAVLNEVMLEARDPSQFATLAALDIRRTPPDGDGCDRGSVPGLTIDLVLAGHPQPVLVRAAGTAELVGDHGTALGLIAPLELSHTRHHLAPGDTLLAYTDGVTEHRGPDGLFDTERLLAAAEHRADSPAELIEMVCASLDAYSRDPARDDIALLAVRATRPAAGRA